MCLERVGAIVLRQIYLLRGSVSRLVPLFAWVGVNMMLWGFTSRYLDTLTGSTHGFMPVLLGATLLWNYFDRVMHGVTTAFFEDVWSRNFLNLFSSPLSVAEYIAGLVVSCLLTSSLGLVMMVVLARYAFGLVWVFDGVALGGFLAVMLIFGLALGIVGSAMVLRMGPAAEWFVWPIPALLSPFVGVFYPQSVLPPWMQAVARGLPPTYVFENLRAFLHGQPWSFGDLAAGGILSALYLAAAIAVFGGVYRSALESGLLARYSAESVG